MFILGKKITVQNSLHRDIFYYCSNNETRAGKRVGSATPIIKSGSASVTAIRCPIEAESL